VDAITELGMRPPALTDTEEVNQLLQAHGAKRGDHLWPAVGVIVANIWSAAGDRVD
jgi:hypothetical protein